MPLPLRLVALLAVTVAIVGASLPAGSPASAQQAPCNPALQACPQP